MLFRHKHNFSSILGHKETVFGIRLYFKCNCGKTISKRYSENDPYIDEGSFPKSKWSGYTWWMHKELKDA